MEKGIRFKLVWEDFHMVEIVVSAWNGEFGGTTKMYLGHGELMEAAKSLEAFPRSPNDARRIALGDIKSDDQASLSVDFYIKDLAGHAALHLNLSTGSYPGPLQKVILHAPIEAAAVDVFTADLAKIEEQIGSTAFLKISL